MTSRLTSEARMPSEPIVMPSEIETVLNSSGVPPACADALLDVRGEIAQVIVAGPDLDPGVGDADQRPLEVVVGQADRAQHRAGRAPGWSPSVRAPLRHFNGCVDIDSESLHGTSRARP